MYVEIEAKLKVESLDAVEHRLVDRGASLLSEAVQTDSYFDRPDGSLKRTDQCLRLRREGAGDSERCIVTYKGAKEHDDFKKRREVNLDVGDAAAAAVLLEALGYEKALVFNKRRRLWQLEECEVALDELPLLGVFVEIEGPDSESIARVRNALGLAEATHVMDSYACLIDEQLSRSGREPREVFLEGDSSNDHETV